MTETIARYRPHRRKVRRLEEERRETIRTYDRSRAPDDAVEGEDVYPARTLWTPQDDGTLISEPLPERRVPWWEYQTTSTHYVGPNTCSDCGGGLGSLGNGMLCLRLAAASDPGPDSIRVEGEGGVIECGLHYVEVEGSDG